jgi:hypothetical protein
MLSHFTAEYFLPGDPPSHLKRSYGGQALPGRRKQSLRDVFLPR